MDHPPPAIPDYELLRRIGRGSYGEVWLARSVTGLYRAVKIIYRHQFEDDRPYEREFAGIKRFEPISRSNESQVDVLHVGRNDASGYFYYVMELADDAGSAAVSPGGLSPESYIPKTLKTVLAERSRLPVSESLQIGLSLTEALAHLHAHGLVHRDVKPSNIIFVNGKPKLADIGLIAATDASQSFVGTEGFVPREGPGTTTADLFALGKVLYETCTGRDRLEFPSLPEDLEALPDRAELGELNEILLKACDPEPSLRYGSAADMKHDLEVVLAQKSVRRLRKLERAVRRGRKLAAVGTLAVLVVGFGWYQSHRFNRMAASQLAHVYVKNGQERLDQNDWLGALPWFSKALDLESGLREREATHRLRVANVLEWCPQLAGLYTHSQPVRYAFFDSDARRVLLCDPGNTAQIWETATDRPLTPILQHEGQPFFGIFSPDGSRAATASRGDGAVRLWDAATGKLIGRPILHDKQAGALAFSPDGRWLATAGEDGLARLWRAADGGETGIAFAHGAPVSLVAFSPEGRRLLTAGGTKDGMALVCVWDAQTARLRGEPIRISDPVSAAAFSPDRPAIVVGTVKGEVGVWNFDPHSERSWALSMTHPIIRTTFSPDGSRLLIASEWSVQLRDGHTGAAVGPAIAAYGTLRSAEFNHDGSRFLLAGESRTAMIYDSRTGRPQIPLIKHGGEIYRALFVRNSADWITASADNTVRRWSPSTGERTQALFVHPCPVKNFFITPDSRRVITVDDQSSLRRWQLDSGASAEQQIRRLAAAPVAAAMRGGGEILLATADGVLSAISTSDFATVATMAGPGAGVDRIVPNPRQAQAAVRSRDGSVWLWDWGRAALECIPVFATEPVAHITFSPDGTLLALAAGKNVATVEVSHGKQRVAARFQHEDRVWHVGFGAKRLLVSSEDRVLRWWNPFSGAPLTPAMRGDGGINFAEFSADHARVFTTSANYDAMTWDATTGKPMTPPFKPRPGVTGAAFSPNDNYVALTSSEGSVQVWDTLSGEAMTPPLRGPGPITQCRFSPDGRWFATVEDARIVTCRPFLLEAPSTNAALERAALLSGYRIDDHGFLAPLTALQVAQLSRTLTDPAPQSH